MKMKKGSIVVRTKDALEEWILYMLNGVEQTSLETIALIENISTLMDKTKNELKEKLPKIYNKDLVEVLFMHPYTKIGFLMNNLGLHRDTASKYLRELEEIEILKSIKIGRSKFFINLELFDILKTVYNSTYTKICRRKSITSVYQINMPKKLKKSRHIKGKIIK